MSIVHTYSVGNGDMFSIRHRSDSYTIIDCNLNDDNIDVILPLLKEQAKDKSISRFISTHPDQDHFAGLEKLDSELQIFNFYCVDNDATKSDETPDFKYYRSLRDGDNAFFIEKGSTRKWLNQQDDERGSAGMVIEWPITDNADYVLALEAAAKGDSPNNISPIISYKPGNGIRFVWMGDLETDFIEKIKGEIEWPNATVLFAPHHGRESGKIPEDVLKAMNPTVIILGEAPSANLNYYNNYNTLTQNSAGAIAFEIDSNLIHIYVGSDSYSVDFLEDYNAQKYNNYIGSIAV